MPRHISRETRRNEGKFWVARHSIKPKKDSTKPEDKESQEYPGISYQGVEHARKNASRLYDELEKTPAGTVMFLGGASDEVRTESTARVFGERLKELAKDREDYIIITKEDLKSTAQGYTEVAREIKQIIESNPNKKIVIDIPMSVKEFSLKGPWMTQDGKHTPYAAALLKAHNNDLNKAMEDWVTNNGKLGELQGPKPSDIGRRYQQGLRKLEDFAASNFVPEGRNLITAIVGHSMDLDAYLAYIAGDGKVDIDSYHKIANGKGMIKEAESASVYIDRKNRKATVSYRDKNSNTTLENIAAAAMIGSFLLSVLFYPNITGNAISVSNTLSYSIIWLIIGIIATILTIVLKRKNKKKEIRFYF